MTMLDSNMMKTAADRAEFKRTALLLRMRRRLFKHVWLLRVLILAGVFAGFYFVVGLSFSALFARFGVSDYGSLVRGFLFTPESYVKSIGGDTNIVILGKGGLGHEAPDLTDTVMLVSVDHKRLGIDSVSLPRDIWIPELRAKLNSVYYWGNQRQENGGLVLVKSTIEQIVGVPVQYGVVVDFSAFLEVVDAIGGIEVTVENSFVDEYYPVPGREDDKCGGDLEYKCRYQRVEFREGLQVMDGQTALKFVRSRNAEGDEGTDIAREKRQQLVLSGIRKKVLSPAVLLSPKKIIKVLEVLRSRIETDMPQSAIAVLARRFMQANGVETHVLPEELLTNPRPSARYDNLYVFIPEAGDWSEVHAWAKKVLVGVN